MKAVLLLIIILPLYADQYSDTQDQKQEPCLCNLTPTMKENSLTTTQCKSDKKQHHNTMSNQAKDKAHSSNSISHLILATYAKLCSEKEDEYTNNQSCSCCGFVSHPIAAIKIAPNKEHTKLLVRVWAQKSELKKFKPINDVEARQLHTLLLQRFQEERKKYLFNKKSYQIDEYTTCYNYELYDKDRGILTCETTLPEICTNGHIHNNETPSPEQSKAIKINDTFTNVIMQKYKEAMVQCQHEKQATEDNDVSVPEIYFKHTQFQCDHLIETVCDDTAHNLDHPAQNHFLNPYFKARKKSSEDVTNVDDATKCYRRVLWDNKLLGWVLCKTYLNEEQFHQYMENNSARNQ